MTVDLHALANLPGAGRAAEALKKAGAWNEAGGGSDLWRVECFGTIPFAVTLIVAADSAEQAETRAAEIIATPDSDLIGSFDTDVISPYVNCAFATRIDE